MDNQIILSICIPTYNRASYLDKLLNSITKQIDGINSVEVLISDNASTDDTQTVVEKYKKLNSKIIYLRNEKNIGAEKNFIQVLNSGKGCFLKLVNDYLEFKENSIDLMLSYIKSNISEKPILFFTNGNSISKTKFECINKIGLEQFLDEASFYTTWIGAIGLWKDDYQNILSKHQFITKNFFQTELLFECFESKNNSIIYGKKIFDANLVNNQHIDYNYFDAFLEDYLNNLLFRLKTTNRITSKCFSKQKKMLFTGFVYPRYKTFKIKKNHSFNINTKGMEKTIFQIYKTCPYFYWYLIYFPVYLFGFFIKKLFKFQKAVHF